MNDICFHASSKETKVVISPGHSESKNYFTVSFKTVLLNQLNKCYSSIRLTDTIFFYKSGFDGLLLVVGEFQFYEIKL
jgi:hypothetical protein